MKEQITNKRLNYLYSRVLHVSSSDFAWFNTIMTGEQPKYYNCGLYGWNYDCFVDYSTDTAIMYGYRNIAKKKANSDVIRKYGKKAASILKRTNWKYETKYRKLAENREQFFWELKEV